MNGRESSVTDTWPSCFGTTLLLVVAEDSTVWLRLAFVSDKSRKKNINSERRLKKIQNRRRRRRRLISDHSI